MEHPFESWNPGEPVSQVDPEDLKALWEHRSAHPREKATGMNGLKHICKPGADIWAVLYRHGLLQFLLDKQFAPFNLALWSAEQAPWLAPWIKEGQPGDAIFRAAAQVSVKWPKEGQTYTLPDDAAKVLPFDVDEFRRLLEVEG
jgi:hypothetical protein